MAAWNHAEAYECYMGRWSRQVAVPFVRWLAPTAGLHWLDVGCGTAALGAAVLTRCAPASVAGVDPSADFLRFAQSQLASRIRLVQAAADRLPWPDASVDCTVSALLLNFAPDAGAAVAEMARVTRPGGHVAAYVWDYGGCMDLIRLYWESAQRLLPVPANADQGAASALCRPQALRALFCGAGLRHVMTTALDIEMHFADFDAYWQPFTGGQGPAPAHAMSLPADMRERLRQDLQARLPCRPDGSIVLQARAWAVRGTLEAR